MESGGGFDRVKMTQVAVADPAPGEITVHLRASSINYHDYAVVSGIWGPSSQRIPLSDGAGEVVAVGEGVTEFQEGDAVVSTFFTNWFQGPPCSEGFSNVPGDGIDGYAREYVTRPATAFTRAPANYSHLEAATLTTAGVTAWRALMVEAPIRSGETVLIQGSGGVSLFALQLARLAGARVIATSSSDLKLARLQALGADEVINYRDEPEWGQRVLALTDQRGVDLVVEVGGPATLEQSMQATRVGGTVAVIGILSGMLGPFSVVTALARQLRLQGILVGSRQHQQALIRALEYNDLHPIIDCSFPLENLVQAFQYEESQQHFGKIAVQI